MAGLQSKRVVALFSVHRSAAGAVRVCYGWRAEGLVAHSVVYISDMHCRTSNRLTTSRKPRFANVLA
jgi:hypothetical protein